MKKKPPIPKWYAHNFDQMLRAASNGDLCVMDTWDTTENEQAILICITQRDEKEVTMLPLAKLISPEEAYQRYLPPSTEGGYEGQQDIVS